jgi:hypothetical protein
VKRIRPNEHIAEYDKSEFLWKLLNAMIADRSDPKKHLQEEIQNKISLGGAVWLTQRTLNPKNLGSNPSRGTVS